MAELFKIGGRSISLDREDVEKRLRNVPPEGIRDLSVTINGIQYPVKQALAAASGLSKSDFTSHEAVRVFFRLGFTSGTESIFETTEELLCPKCSKPYVFKVSSKQAVFEGCNCNVSTLPENLPQGSIISWIGTNGIAFLRVPKRFRMMA